VELQRRSNVKKLIHGHAFPNNYSKLWTKKLKDYCKYLVRETDSDNLSILTLLIFKLKRIKKSLLEPSVKSKRETKKAAQDVKKTIILLERVVYHGQDGKTLKKQKDLDEALKMISKNIGEWWG
jgi:hypothetical protein